MLPQQEISGQTLQQNRFSAAEGAAVGKNVKSAARCENSGTEPRNGFSGKLAVKAADMESARIHAHFPVDFVGGIYVSGLQNWYPFLLLVEKPKAKCVSGTAIAL